MSHLRAPGLPGLTAPVRELPVAAPGVAHVTPLAGALVTPDGDVAEAALIRECADRVLPSLTGLGRARHGGITLASLATVVSGTAERADEAVPVDPADEVSRAESVVGFPAAMGFTAAAWLGFHAVGLGRTASLGQLTDVDFSYQVEPFSLIIELLAGAAGTLSLTSAKSCAPVGVVISVTTALDAAFATIAILEGRCDRVLSSSVQLPVNLVGIVSASVAVLVLSRLSSPDSALGQRRRRE